jgi:hypothetical protein
MCQVLGWGAVHKDKTIHPRNSYLAGDRELTGFVTVRALEPASPGSHPASNPGPLRNLSKSLCSQLSVFFTCKMGVLRVPPPQAIVWIYCDEPGPGK